jgi:hypothetical protein
MKANEFIYKVSQGKNSTLDKAYYKHINNLFDDISEEKQERWETYNIIIGQLVEDGKLQSFSEIKYRLTDGEDPNAVILDILERFTDEMNSTLWFLKRKLEEYKEDDYLSRFYE